MLGTRHPACARTALHGSPVVDLLTSKAARAGGWGRKGDPAETAQDCRRCGTRGRKDLADRGQAGPVWGRSIDRDGDAARHSGTRGLAGSPPSGGHTPSGTAGPENGGDCSLSRSFP